MSRNHYLVGPFYPNAQLRMIEEGDLAHHTEHALKRDIIWRTDQLGFRNDRYLSKPEVILLGDSNIAGSSVSQEQTLSSRLMSYTGMSVYNLAPISSINVYFQLKNASRLQLPKLLVVSCIERGLAGLKPLEINSKLKYSWLRLHPLSQFILVQIDKLYRLNSLRWLRSTVNRAFGIRQGIQSQVKDGMYFLQGQKVITLTDSKLEQVVENIKGYKSYCDSQGCEFLFLPIPNKETIYWELAGLDEQPSNIIRLHQRLKNNGIYSIETVNLFNAAKELGRLPYNPDDSHWNEYGIEIVTQEIIRIPFFCKSGTNLVRSNDKNILASIN
ncbi:hypothetical protein JXQ70_19155 [bacterium]|nr:hypothetical protein [bacterium]